MSAPRYTEPGRTYVTSLAFLAIIGLGFLLDLTFGAGLDHLIGWLIAAFFIAGTDALGVYAARVMRSISITDTDLVVGEDTVALDDIVSAAVVAEPEGKVLGRRYTDTIPRGHQAVGLELTDDRQVIVATRKPDALMAALGAKVPEVSLVRMARPEDLADLGEIDDRADSLFRVAGLEVPATESTPDALRTSKAVLVIGRPPVGYARLGVGDGEVQLQRLAVLPGNMRAGHGSALLEAVCAWGRERSMTAVVLTAYADVDWNAAYFARRGFVELTDQAAEPDSGGRRVVMRREL